MPMTVLTIQADIVGSVIMVPAPRIMVGSARGANPANRVLVVQDPREPGELVISDVRTELEWLTVSARRIEVEEPGDGRFPKASPGNWIVRAEVDADAPHGTTRTEVTFKTGLEREPEVTLPIIVAVVPSVVVNPERLRLDQEGAGGRLTGSLVAIVRMDLRGEELVVEASSDAVEVSTESAGVRRYRIHASIPTGSLSPDDHLILRVGDSRPVEVPLFPPLATPTAAP
jgi:hypothetical protein